MNWLIFDIYYVLADIPVIAHDIVTCPQKVCGYCNPDHFPTRAKLCLHTCWSLNPYI